MVLRTAAPAAAQHPWWAGEDMRRSERGAPMGPCRGTSAALLTSATGYLLEENVSSPSLQPQAWKMWGAGQPVLASVEASGDKAG